MPILENVRDYYEARLQEHGATPRGVDWNGEESQFTRFQALSRILPDDHAASFSVDDYGCGYGAYVDYLSSNGGWPQADYLGLDVSAEMVAAAQVKHPTRAFATGSTSPRTADYAVASGIFNVALETPRDTWQQYILDTLDAMHAATSCGFAFNCLTSYSDPGFLRPHLYYGDPCFFFDHCKRRYSRQVALLHDYGLYEFTILVRKNA
jgi:SAM-dependent methyltransferase